MRAAAQIVSYEIAMGFALVAVLVAAGSLNLGEIVLAQSGFGFLTWFWIPLFPILLVYFISGLAETNRAPFDVSEGESEIVAGFHVEILGHGVRGFLYGRIRQHDLGIHIGGGDVSRRLVITLCRDPGTRSHHRLDPRPCMACYQSCVFFCSFFLWLRATFPRYRYDQVMRLGWKVFIPITIVWLVLVGGMVLLAIPPWFD